MKQTYLLAVLLFLFLAACTGSPEEKNPLPTLSPVTVGAFPEVSSKATRIPSPSFTPTSPPSPSASSTPSPTVRMTFTPRPTATASATPLPTATPTALPTPPVLLQMGSSGGDGGSNYDQYYGRGMPSLILYTDGRLLRRIRGEGRVSSYVESRLSEQEQCVLLEQIAQTGFLELPYEGYSEEIYEFDETTQYSDGAGGVTILINGEQPKGLYIYGPYLPYTITEVRSVYDLLEGYQPLAVPYRPERLLLWIEPGMGFRTYLADQITPTPWPLTLPSLEQLHAGRTPVPYYIDDTNPRDPVVFEEGGEVLLRGEQLDQIWDYLGQEMRGGWFVQEGESYYVIVRLLLPHEEGVTWMPWEPYRFEMPFSCAAD